LTNFGVRLHRQNAFKLKKAFVKEIINELPEPKPEYSTVSTIIKILEIKGVISYEAFGKTRRYYPLIEKEEYMHQIGINFMSDNQVNKCYI
jgi:BlaI family penicillinase repressor